MENRKFKIDVGTRKRERSKSSSCYNDSWYLNQKNVEEFVEKCYKKDESSEESEEEKELKAEKTRKRLEKKTRVEEEQLKAESEMARSKYQAFCQRKNVTLVVKREQQCDQNITIDFTTLESFDSLLKKVQTKLGTRKFIITDDGLELNEMDPSEWRSFAPKSMVVYLY